MHEEEADNMGSHLQSPECRASSQIINGKEDKEDKEPWPAKRQKQNLQLTCQALAYIE
jgi:hypothetical protein